MNILPTVMILILLFAISSTYFLHESIDAKVQEKSFRGFMRAERLIRNRKASKSFLSFLSSEQKTLSPSKIREKNYTCPREKTPPLEAGRLNLYPLFQEPFPTLLYEVAANLIYELYAKRPFFRPYFSKDLSYQLLDALIDKGKKNLNATSFFALFPSESHLFNLFYHMLQGTGSYDLNKTGVPPFEDFFMLKQKQKPIAFSFASMPLLIAALGKGLAKEIKRKEEEKWKEKHQHRPLKEEDLNLLISKDAAKALKQTSFQELFHFSSKHSSKEYIKEQDIKTGITVKQKLYN